MQSNNFGDQFVDKITNGDKFEICKGDGLLFLRDESNEGRVQRG